MAANRGVITSGADKTGTEIAEDINDEFVEIWKNIGGDLNNVSGTNSITANAPVTVSQYYKGMRFSFIVQATNTSSVTINIDSVGIVSILSKSGGALSSGDLVSGDLADIIYNSDDGAFRLLNKGSEITAAVQSAIISYETAFGVNPSAASFDTWSSYPFNTVVSNTIGGSNLTSSTLSLPPGNYTINGKIRVFGEEARGALRLYDDSASVYLDDQCVGLTYRGSTEIKLASTSNKGNSDHDDYSDDGIGYAAVLDEEGYIHISARIISNTTIDLQLHYYIESDEKLDDWETFSGFGRAAGVSNINEVHGYLTVDRVLPFSANLSDYSLEELGFPMDISGDNATFWLDKTAEGDDSYYEWRQGGEAFARAGLIGDNDWTLSVSGDNFSTSYDAIVVDKDSGDISFPYDVTIEGELVAGDIEADRIHGDSNIHYFDNSSSAVVSILMRDTYSGGGPYGARIVTGNGTNATDFRGGLSGFVDYFQLNADNHVINFGTNGSRKLQFSTSNFADFETSDISTSGVYVLGSFTVATLPTASSFTGGLIYVTDESGGAIPCFSDGTNWRRVSDRTIVS